MSKQNILYWTIIYVCVGFVCVQIKLFHSHSHSHYINFETREKYCHSRAPFCPNLIINNDNDNDNDNANDNDNDNDNE